MISHSRPQQEQTAPKPQDSAPQDSAPQDSAPQDSERALTARLRAVHRAASDLRRGIPVVLRAPGAAGEDWLLLAAETAGERGVEELRRLAAVPPVLLLAPTRAAAVLHRPVVSLGGAPEGEAVALRLPAALMIPAALRALADPTLDQARPAEPEALATTPGTAGSALALAKLGRLLPAVLAAPLAREIADREIAARRLLEAGADEVRAYPEAAALSLLRAAEARVPLEDAPDARIIAFRVPASGVEHLAILVGRPEKVAVPLVRLHSECFTGDVLGSLRCDCGLQLRGAIKRMGEEGAGILLYLAQEGRGIGLLNKLRAYALQDRGLDTLDANRALGWGADERSFLVAATMLEALGVHQLRLLTNNPDKVEALGACGVSVAERVPLAFAPNGVNDRYLETKARRFGHLLG